MTLSPMMSDDAMTISATDYAFGDFSLGLVDALCLTNVDFLVVTNVVKMQGVRMGLVAAIYAPLGQFISIQPTSYGCRSCIGLRVDAFPISRDAGEAFLPPCRAFRRIVWPLWARFTICLLYFFWVGFAPLFVCLSRGLGMALSKTPSVLSAFCFLFFRPFTHVWSII
jgi:hypothetical protein